MSLVLNIVLSSFVGRPVNLPVKACRAIMLRSLDDLFHDSSDAVPPCDEINNVMIMDLPNVDDVWNAGASVSKTSVSAPKGVCN